MGGEDPGYVADIKQLPCAARYLGPCTGGYPDAHHAGPRGLGQKAHDDTCIPLCRGHHTAWHDCNGVFRGWSKDQRLAWAQGQIATTRRLLGRADPDGEGLE